MASAVSFATDVESNYDSWTTPATFFESSLSTREAYNQSEIIIPTFWQMELAHSLFIYVSPVLIVCGTIGNVLSLCVLQSILFRKMPCSFLLSALAVVDTGVLLTGLLRHWIRVITDNKVDIRYQSEGSCKAHVYLTYLFPLLSSWTLVLLSIERTISVANPLHAKVICSRKRMILAWCFVTFCLAALDVHFLFIFTMRKTENSVKAYCTVREQSFWFFTHIWVWFDFVFVAMIPVLIISACNVVIIVKMCRASRRRPLSNNTDVKQGRSMRSTTVMLVIVNLVFLITNLPMGIFFLGRPYWPDATWNEMATIELIYAVFSLNSYLNNAINFLLYCISGSRFRQALLSALCLKKVPMRTSTYRAPADEASTRRSSVATIPSTLTVSEQVDIESTTNKTLADVNVSQTKL